MAGSFPDAPGARVEYDRDGSGIVSFNATVTATRTLAEAQAINDEAAGAITYGGATTSTGAYVAVVFPQPREIQGVYYSTTSSAFTPTTRIDYSLDTTSGHDGVWTTVVAAATTHNELAVASTYRSSIITAGFPVANVKGIRVFSTNSANNTGLRALHIYGRRTPTVGDWLELWHPTLNQSLAVTPALSDLGDVPRGAGFRSFSFRVKNCSATLTAQSITLSRDALTDGTPTTVSLITLQHNGLGYGTNPSVGTLTPGQISAVCDARIEVQAGAPVGVWAPRIIASAGTWV